MIPRPDLGGHISQLRRRSDRMDRQIRAAALLLVGKADAESALGDLVDRIAPAPQRIGGDGDRADDLDDAD